jgi:glycine/D-amino acid oxidase-like deaminating enzyme
VGEQTQVLIAGGGILGSAIAAALVERQVRDVIVVDLDLYGPRTASELDAVGVRATWWNEINIASCRDTILFFEEHAQDLSLLQPGYLWLYDDRDLFRTAIERQKLQGRLGWEVEILTPGETERRFPHLDRWTDEIVGSTFSPRDGLVDPEAVRCFYRERAQAGGVRFLNHYYLEGVETVEGEGGRRRVQLVHLVEVAKGDATGGERTIEKILTRHRIPPEVAVDRPAIQAELVVNALGAWSPIFSSKLGIRDVAVPVRRQISLVDPGAPRLPDGVDLSRLGMVVDASKVYYHPRGPRILTGYSSPAAYSGYDFQYDGDCLFEQAIRPRLVLRSSVFDQCDHVGGGTRLYSVTPDCSGVVGWVSGFSNLIEVHGFASWGVMQSRALGRGVAELICEGSYETLDLSPLASERFTQDRASWISEDLHI